LDLVVELLAVVLSGAAYVPIDPELPPSRASLLAQDAGICALLGNSQALGGFPALADLAIAVDRILEDLPPSGPRTCDAAPEDTAYVIYTSGSTGRPKGVAVPHRGVVNRLMWMQEKYELAPDSTVLQKTPFTFDVSVWEFFWPLLVGARLHLAPPAAHRDPKAIADIVRRHQVDVVHFVPSMLDLFLTEPAAAGLGSLRHVMASGEALSTQTVERFHRVFAADDTPARLHNLYGPTEASIDVTHWECTPAGPTAPVPIGRAVPNTALYVLDAYGAPAPFGVAGELCIAGVQVAAGYLNQEEATGRSFVPNPFGPGTLYRTGDAAAMGPDGVLYFLGRLDSQIKVRGMRVEPGEVESVLLAHPDVAQAVVLAPHSAGGGHRLLAHVVAREKRPLTGQDVLDHAREHLPEHMVPAAVGVAARFPTLASGKVDRKALASASVGAAEPQESLTPPSGEVEQCLHDVWTGVLGVRTIDVNSSFFALGADSMHCIRARSAMERYGWTCSVAEIFEAPTIRSLALVVRSTEGVRTPERTQPFALVRPQDRALLPPGVVDAYPLSRMQFGILYHSDDSENTSVYRVVVSVEVPLPLDEQHLREALRATADRHPALRTSYHLSGYSQALQVVHGAVEVPLESSDALLGRSRDVQQERLRHWVEAAKHQDFDLARPPLLRFTAHRLDSDSFQLSVVEHHVVLDGWSDAGMVNEIVERYRARFLGEDLRLSSVPSTYRDFVAAELRAENDPSHRQFWLEELSGAAHHPLPRTAPGTTGTAPQHRRYTVPVPRADTRGLFGEARRAGLPVKAVCAALHLAVMDNFHAGEDVLTGVVANTRLEEPGGDEAIGVFLNTLPLGVRVGEATWLDLANEVHDWERRAAPHRRYPYAKIREDHEDLELDSYVNFMDFHRQLSFDPARANSLGAADTNFPLAVNFLIDADRRHLDLWLDCDTAQLDQDLCERLVRYYRNAVRAFLAQPGAGVREVPLSPDEEVSLLGEWGTSTVAFDQDATIGSLIAGQAARTPTAVAVTHSGRELTYAQLMRAADSALLRLRHSGVGPGGRVGLNLARGLDLMVLLVAIARSGAAYVPLDPDFPAERLRHIAEDAALDCLVTDTPEGEKLPARAVVRWDDRQQRIRRDRPGTVPAEAAPTDPVYILYTSGSTGAPKGAPVSHRNLVNLFAGMNERIAMGPDDAVLALTSVSFDISTVELLWPLCRGATVVVAGPGLIGRLEPGDGPESFAELCLREKVTLVQATPSFMAVVADRPGALQAMRGARVVLLGGEVFPPGTARRLVRELPRTRIINGYGPTEATVYSSMYELEGAVDREALPIGRPVANTLLRVLAEDGHRLLPPGVEGELWIGGQGVVEGYLNREQMTKERFVRAPDGGRWYRTGDRCRWRADGQLEFLGRKDRQIKVAGHRIELDEIESVLSLHPEVSSAAVSTFPGPGGSPQIVAYVAPAAESAAEAEQAHMGTWGEVWDRVYDGSTSRHRTAPEAHEDFSGWQSSYTKAPIPVAQMRDWLERTVARVRELRAGTVVDVGMGVGLLMEPLLAHVSAYHGIEPSAAALRAAAARVGERDRARVRLDRGDAAALAEVDSTGEGVVVLNSIIQYFPGPEYLSRVLEEAVRVAGPRGAVFIGDVRDLRLLEAFHADTSIQAADPLTPGEQVAAAVERACSEESELCVDPRFFHRFSTASPHVGGVLVELKRARHHTEMARFRYDVTLWGRDRPAPARAGGITVPWQDLAAGAGARHGERVRSLIADAPADQEVTVTGIPDRRLARPLAAVAALGEDLAGVNTWDLQRLVWEADSPHTVDPEHMALLGESVGRRTRLIPGDRPGLGRFAAVFEAAAQKGPRGR
jgi:amino acid adenylation domain-containing protein